MIRLLLQLSSSVINALGYRTTYKQEQKFALFSFISFLRLLFAPCIYVYQRLCQRLWRRKHKASAALAEQRNRSKSRICGLPQELRDEILSHLSISSIATAKMSCRTLNNSGPSESCLWIQIAREVETRFTSVWILDNNATGTTLAEAGICLIFVTCLWCELLVPLLSTELPGWVYKGKRGRPQLHSLSKLRRWNAVFEHLYQYAAECGFLRDHELRVSCVKSESDFPSRLMRFLISCSDEL